MKKASKSPIHLREDALTALNLLDLHSLASGRLEIIDFTPYIESRITGADWEWWFVQKGHAYGAAVQAKMLKPSGRYDTGYTSPDGYPQIKRLLDYCRNKGDLSPLYCFYNYWADGRRSAYSVDLQPGFCPAFPLPVSLWGCSLAHATAIWKLHCNSQDHLRDVLPLSSPWHCIVCCESRLETSAPIGPATVAYSVTKYLRKLGDHRPTYQNRKNDYHFDDIGDPKLSSSLPSRVLSLMEKIRKKEELDSAIIYELWGELPPAHLVIYGNR